MAATMIPLKILTDKSLFTLLYKIDQKLAEQTRSRGCPYCGGPLHYANYQRKPRGGPPELVAALRQLKKRDITLERIKSICGALRSTVNRWRDYFQNIFPQSINYRRLAGHYEFDRSSEPLIHNVLEHFFSTCREPKTALGNCLQALA